MGQDGQKQNIRRPILIGLAVLLLAFGAMAFYYFIGKSGASGSSTASGEASASGEEHALVDAASDATGGQAEWFLTQDIDTEGFLQARDGHFYYENGERAKLWGVNLAYDACFPEKEEAERMAELFQRLGFNSVRLLSLDSTNQSWSYFSNIKENTTQLSEESLDRMDYLIYCLKEKGIRTVLCVHSERIFTEADGVADAGKLAQGSKYATIFNRRMIDLQKQLAKELLTRTNSYTGLRYADDPAVAMFQLTNENSLFGMWYEGKTLPDTYEQELTDLFHDWLRETYGTDQAVTEAWNSNKAIRIEDVVRPRYSERGKHVPGAVDDLIRFYAELERDYYHEMMQFYRDELGIKAPIGGNTAYFGPAYLEMVAEETDFTSAQTYYDMIEFPGRAWDYGNFKQKNTSMIQTDGMAEDGIYSLLGTMSFSAVEGKPVVVSEWNSCYPNDYQYETAPAVAAYAALQDWDAMFAFVYSYGPPSKPEGREHMINDFFLLENNLVKLAQMPVCSNLFLRGDVSAAKKTINVPLPEDERILLTKAEIYHDSAMRYSNEQIPSTLIYQSSIRRSFTGEEGEELILPEELPSETRHESDTGQLLWDCENAGGEYIAIDTDNSQGAVGFLAGQTISLGSVTIAAESDCSVLLTSLDGSPINSSDHLYLSAAGRIQNKNQKKNSTTNGLTSWGENAVEVESLSGAISIRTAHPGREYFLWTLTAEGGRITSEVLTADADGLLTIPFQPGILGYELIVEGGGE